MKTCSNCGKSHGPLKRYMWNTYTKKLNIAQSNEGLLCETCAKSLGAWQTIKQDPIEILPLPIDPMFDEESITIGTPEEAITVAMSLTDEDIERLEREEKYSSLN